MVFGELRSNLAPTRLENLLLISGWLAMIDFENFNYAQAIDFVENNPVLDPLKKLKIRDEWSAEYFARVQLALEISRLSADKPMQQKTANEYFEEYMRSGPILSTNK